MAEASESVLEDVRVVLEYAKEHKLLDAPALQGSNTVFDPVAAKEKFLAGSDYLGVAANFFGMDLLKWAVKGQVVAKVAARAFGKKHFLDPLEKYLKTGSQSSAARIAAAAISFKEPVGIAVLGESPGPIGQWRRLSLDLQTFGLIVVWADLLRQKPHDAETLAKLTALSQLARHCPMNFYHFGVSENLEKDMFKKSFEIMESYRKKEEVHAPGGWQVCCLFAAARELQTKEFISGSPPGDAKKGGKEDGGVAVVEFFHDFEFAETSEYKKLDKKMGKDCLLVYERVTKAGLATLMSSTWVRLGHKNALDTMTGLVKISQRMASATTSNSQPELLQKMRFVMEYLYVRMVAGTLDSQIGTRPLNNFLVVPLTALKLMDYMKLHFPYSRNIEKNHLDKFWSPIEWLKQANSGSQPGADVGMILQPSCKMFSHFLRGLYEGRWDTVINEIEAQDMKNLSALAIFEYPKFGMADAQAMYRKEKIQQESASRFAAMPSSGSQPVQVDVEEEDLPQQSAAIPEGAAGGEVDAEDDDMDAKKQQDKEKTIKEARLKHVTAAMQERVRFVVRPSTKAGYEAVLSESALIQNRHTLAPAHNQEAWRHGWVYDVGCDVEPTIGETSKRSAWAWPPAVDVPGMTLFVTAAIGCHNETNDIFIMPTSRGKMAQQEYQKVLSKVVKKDDLFISYKECIRRGARNSMEVVHAALSKPWPGGARTGARKIHTATSLASNCLAGVIDYSSLAESDADARVGGQVGQYPIDREAKEAILGLESLSEREKALPPTGRVVLFHWEKTVHTWMDIFDHFGLTSIATCTVGRLPMLIAAMKMNIKVLAMCKNESHMALVKKDLLDYMLAESQQDQEAEYYVSRAKLIDEYGLQPDEAAPVSTLSEPAPRAVEPPQPEGQMDSEEEEEPEEEDPEEPEEEEGENPEEEEGENPEEGEDPEEPEEPEESAADVPEGKKGRKRGADGKPKEKKKAKGKGKGKAKPKAKPKRKALAKGEAKPKRKPKAKAPEE